MTREPHPERMTPPLRDGRRPSTPAEAASVAATSSAATSDAAPSSAPALLVITGAHVEVWHEPLLAAIRALDLMHTSGRLATLQLDDPALVLAAMRRTLEIVPRARWRNLEREAPLLLPASPDDLVPA